MTFTQEEEAPAAQPQTAAQQQAQLEKDLMLETGSVLRTKGRHAIHCLTVIGQIEGHSLAPQNQKTTKYEHVIPQLISIEEDPEIEGLLVILNTVGGDVEAGLALAELISGISKPSATLVLGGGHSIGIPLAVAAQRSFIVPTATMTVHPVRHSGLVLGVPQTMRYFEQMQQRITRFVTGHSAISAERFTQLMLHTGELVMDVGSVLDGRAAVREGLIDALGSVGDALAWLYAEIERRQAQTEGRGGTAHAAGKKRSAGESAKGRPAKGKQAAEEKRGGDESTDMPSAKGKSAAADKSGGDGNTKTQPAKGKKTVAEKGRIPRAGKRGSARTAKQGADAADEPAVSAQAPHDALPLNKKPENTAETSAQAPRGTKPAGRTAAAAQEGSEPAMPRRGPGRPRKSAERSATGPARQRARRG